MPYFRRAQQQNLFALCFSHVSRAELRTNLHTCLLCMRKAPKSGFGKLRYKKLQFLSGKNQKGHVCCCCYLFFSWMTKSGYLRSYQYFWNPLLISVIFRNEYSSDIMVGMYAIRASKKKRKKSKCSADSYSSAKPKWDKLCYVLLTHVSRTSMLCLIFLMYVTTTKHLQPIYISGLACTKHRILSLHWAAWVRLHSCSPHSSHSFVKQMASRLAFFVYIFAPDQMAEIFLWIFFPFLYADGWLICVAKSKESVIQVLMDKTVQK